MQAKVTERQQRFINMAAAHADEKSLKAELQTKSATLSAE